MSPRTAKILYKIDRTIRPVFEITSVLALILMVVAAIDTPAKQALTYILYAVAAVWATAFVCRICLSPFVISDEEEDFEKKVDYILQKKQTAQPSVPYSPLAALSDQQELQIKQLLHSLPEHPEKPGHINLALVAQYLTALEKMGKADLKDKRNLRMWIAQTTGKQVPSTSQFNEAVPSRAASKVAAARKELENLLQ